MKEGLYQITYSREMISQKDRFRNILANKIAIGGHIGLVNVALNWLSTF
jgi:hypothetical protein